MDKRGIARLISMLIFLGCFGYLGFYYYQMHRTSGDVDKMQKETSNFDYSSAAAAAVAAPISKTAQSSPQKDDKKLYILHEYESLYKKNQNLIGWLKIDDTSIDYPVMKSVNGHGEYYLNHNFDQQEDRNGTLFMDDNCDVIRPSENWIIYGHNMKSGKMFGTLSSYKSADYCKSHPTVQFNTLYEYGYYYVMFAFQTHVYSESEIAFKYYQFIDPASEAEFNSGMNEMRKMALYDTGVDASYGDRLLFLSTCDYDESNGRFVVVCKKK